eukprot:scaffold38823_cov60-Phaeocystis_antarctica.AAC.4
MPGELPVLGVELTTSAPARVAQDHALRRGRRRVLLGVCGAGGGPRRGAARRPRPLPPRRARAAAAAAAAQRARG